MSPPRPSLEKALFKLDGTDDLASGSGRDANYGIVFMGIDGDKIVPIIVDNGYLLIRDYGTELALGNIPGRVGVNMEGHNPDVNSQQEVVWDQGGLYTYLTEDTDLYISSDDAADDNVDIVIEGLNENGIEMIALVTTNGQTQVKINVQFYRVLRCYVAVPAADEPVGNLYIAEQDTLSGGVPETVSKIKAKIIAGINRTRMGMVTIPAGKTVVVKNVRGSVGKGKDCTLQYRIRYYGGVWFSFNPFHLYQSTFEFSYPFTGITFPQLTDFEIRASSSVNSPVSAETDGEYVDN